MKVGKGRGREIDRKEEGKTGKKKGRQKEKETGKGERMRKRKVEGERERGKGEKIFFCTVTIYTNDYKGNIRLQGMGKGRE